MASRKKRKYLFASNFARQSSRSIGRVPSKNIFDANLQMGGFLKEIKLCFSLIRICWTLDLVT